MKKLFLVLGILVVLIAGAVIAAPFLVPTETIKSQLTAQVENATGRKLTVDGDLNLSLLPNVAVEMNDVHFANAPGSEVADMASLDALKVVLKVMPLFSGSVEVSQFVLVEPKIHLEVDAEGKPNWELLGTGDSASDSGTAGDQSATSGEGDSGGSDLPISGLKLGDIRLENGSLTFVDHTAGTKEDIEAINMKLSLDDIRSPLQMLGSLDYKGETIELDLGLDDPESVIKGDESPFKLGVKSGLLQLGFTGDLKNQGSPSAAGGIDLSVPSIKKLVAWLAEPIDFDGQGLESLTIAGQLNGSAERIAFTDATISLDQIQGNGEVTADLAGAVPKIGGRLDLGAVDLNPYLPPPAEGADETSETATEPSNDENAAPASTDWSDEPIDIPPLNAVDLAFELTLDSLKVRELKLDRTVLALSMADNALTAELKEFGLYEGSGSGALTLNVADGRPSVEEKFTLTGLQALPFLTDAAEFDRLEGTANAEFVLTTTGGTERELVQNLNGNGKVVFADGAISGINIAAMVRNASTAFLSAEANETRKTDFAELSGSFTIQNGRLNNQDLNLQAPALRVAGSGTVDLPAKQVDYRIDPKAAATLEGQGSETDVAGLLVPVVVTGPFDDLSYKPDLSGVIDQAIKDPKALKKQVKQQIEDIGKSGKDLKEQLKSLDKDNAKDLLEGLTKGGDDTKGSPAGNLLEGLLKR